MEGYSFIWEKSRGSEDCIEEKLDKALANAMCCSIFFTAKVVNVDTFSSYHYAIFLDFSSPYFSQK